MANEQTGTVETDNAAKNDFFAALSVSTVPVCSLAIETGIYLELQFPIIQMIYAVHDN